MTGSRQPVSFVATRHPEAARAFYGDVLGLRLRERSDYALVFEDGAHILRVQIVPTLSPAPHTVYGWQVTDIAHEIATLNAHGVVFLTFAHFDQSPSGVWTTPDGHQIAWFKDPDENILSLTQYARPDGDGR